MLSLRNILLVAVFLLGAAWGVTFVVFGHPNLILAIATMGAGLGLLVLTFRGAKKSTDGDEGE